MRNCRDGASRGCVGVAEVAVQTLNTLALGVNLFVVLYGLTLLLLRKQQPQQLPPR
jgi:hypothetical protein